MVSAANRDADTPDATAYFASDFGCQGAYNLNAFCNLGFDAIWQSAATADERNARSAIFAKAAQYLINHKIGLPVYHDTSRRAYSTRVHDMVIDPLGLRLVTHKTSLVP